MRMPFAKSDPIADASAAVDALAARRDRLAERQAGAAERLAAADAARLEALTAGDPTPAEMTKLDRACADAANAHGGLVSAMALLTAQHADAVATRDALRDAAERARVAEDCEHRAAAIDAAAEAYAAAALAFGEARTAMVRAIVDHGARVENPLSTDGSAPAAALARPITLAAVRMAAPGVLPAEDGLGAAFDSDPVMVARRAQSGRLRDHGDAVREGRLPPADHPRPNQPGAAPRDPNDPFVKGPTERIVFAERYLYLTPGGGSVTGEPGEAEVPARVAAVAREMGIAHDVGSDAAADVIRKLKAAAPGYTKPVGRPPEPVRFIDTDDGVVSSAPVRTAHWPDADRDLPRPPREVRR